MTPDEPEGPGEAYQGVMQTVQASTFGVDPRTGRSLRGTTAGRVRDQMVGVIKNRLAAQGGPGKAGEALLPVYDGDGEVAAYERSMAPEKLEALADISPGLTWRSHRHLLIKRSSGA